MTNLEYRAACLQYGRCPVWVTYIHHYGGGATTTLEYGSLSAADDSLRYQGIGRDRIVKVVPKEVPDHG